MKLKTAIALFAATVAVVSVATVTIVKTANADDTQKNDFSAKETVNSIQTNKSDATSSNVNQIVVPTTPDVTDPTDATQPSDPAVTDPTDPEVTEPAVKPTAKPTKPTKTPVEETTKPTVKPTDPPATSKPAETKPSKPVVTDPVVTDPEITQPEITEPEITEPTAPTTKPTEPTVHKCAYVAVMVVAPNCTTDGYTVYQCTCGDAYNSDFIAKVNHNYVDTVVAPTVDAEGYTSHVCIDCGDNYIDSYVEKLPVVETKPAVDKNDGSDTHEHVCSGECHEEVQRGGFTYIYCDSVEESYKSEDGYTIYHPYDYFF